MFVKMLKYCYIVPSICETSPQDIPVFPWPLFLLITDFSTPVHHTRKLPGYLWNFFQQTTYSIITSSQTNSAFCPLWDGNEYRPKCGDAVRLGVKGRMAHSIRGQTYGLQVRLCHSYLVNRCRSEISVLMSDKRLRKCPVFILIYRLL